MEINLDEIHMSHAIVFKTSMRKAEEIMNYLKSQKDVYIVYQKHSPSKLMIVKETENNVRFT